MTTALKGQEFVLQSAATAASNGTPAAVSQPVVGKHVVIVKGTGTISGGTISIEEADTVDYAGTWSVITTVTASGLTGGAIQVVHIDGLIRALRARISAEITGGGSISASLVSS